MEYKIVNDMLYEDVRQCIEENGLIQKGDRVGVAVSGGADSVVLAFLLCAMSKKTGFDLVILHYEHGIRGEESIRDMKFVEKFAEGLSVPIIVERGDVPQEAKGESLESVARRLRYDFFLRVKRERGLASIAVAHHMGDLAETLVMNLVRGAGVDGLVAMRPKREPGIIRPMLYVKKQQILDFAEAYRLPFVYDSSNDSVEYTRNFVRREIMPKLNQLNPSAQESITRAYWLLRDDLDLLREYTEKEWAQVAKWEEGGVTLDLPKFQQLPLAMQRRIVRMAVGKIDSLVDIEKQNIDQIVRLAQGNRTGKYTKKNNVLASVAYDKMRITRRPQGEPRETQREERPLREIAAIESCNAPPESFPKGNSLTQYVDGDQLEGAVVRGRRQGDSFRPFGMKGMKKLSDWLIDKKIPREKRDQLALVARGGEILWIGGLALSEAMRVSQDTKNIVKITLPGEFIDE